MDDIYKLKLHEIHSIENTPIYVIRVPGGWLYTVECPTGDTVQSFVPYNQEFMGEG